MKQKTIIIGFVAFLANSVFAYNFLFTSHNEEAVAIANENGKILWKMKADHPQRADISADGKHIFVSTLHGAFMAEVATKKILWKYNCPTVKWQGAETDKRKKGDTVQLQNPVAQILGNDRFLVGNEGISTLLEINSKGEVLKEIKSESLKKAEHGEFRLASKTSDGKYIFPLLESALLTVYNSDGKQLRRIQTSSGVVSAEILDDNSILAGGIFGIAVFDKNNKKIWSFTDVELQKALGTKAPVIICDVKVLPNKNLLCTTYGDKSIPDVIELTFAKKIVKTIDFPQHCEMSALQILDNNLKPIK